MVVRCACAILLGIAALQSLALQTVSRPKGLPSISISLPPDVPSETVQIAYHLVGPFGGYGGYSGNSSRNNTPLCPSDTSPGRGTAPPPINPASEIVWCGDRNGRVPTNPFAFSSTPATL
jgi:hypothetical protein